MSGFNAYFNRLAKIAYKAQISAIESYKGSVGIYSGEFSKVLSEHIIDRGTGVFEQYFNQYNRTTSSMLNLYSALDMRTYLPEDIMTKVDRMSMAHSIEAREPLLDHNLIEFSLSIDPRYKLSAFGNGKVILKSVAQRLVPEGTIKKRKMGFAVPLKIWYRNELKDEIISMSSDPNLKVFEFIERKKFRQIIEEHLSGMYDNSDKIWTVHVMSSWLRQNYAANFSAVMN